MPPKKKSVSSAKTTSTPGTGAGKKSSATKKSSAAKKTPARKKSSVRSRRFETIYQLKATLQDFRPPIWRRLLVPGEFTLGDLHWVLQFAFGWTNSHLHQFVTKDRTFYSDPMFQLGEGPFGMRVHNEKRTRLDSVPKKPKDKFTYEYDFGDSWEHELLVEKILDPDPDATYPACLAGKMAGPPEDVGGVWGYAELLDILADQSHPEREERLEWVAEDFDPEAFDLAAINRELAKLQ